MYSRMFVQWFAEDDNVLTKHDGQYRLNSVALYTIERCYANNVIENDICVIGTFAQWRSQPKKFVEGQNVRF